MGYLDSNDPDILAYTNQLRQQTQTPPGVLNQIDPKWLALAQGFLAPTKTGGFGESLGNAAGQLQGPLSQMKQQQMSAMEKIAALKETQARLALAKEKQDKDSNSDNDYINNEYKRAQALNTYGNMYDRLRSSYMDITGTKFISPEKETEFRQKSQPILDAMDALHNRSRPGGASSIEGATSGGQGNKSISVENPTVTTTPRQGQGQQPLKEGDVAYNPQGVRFKVKDGKLVQDQAPGQK